jgi:hypothetical protein
MTKLNLKTKYARSFLDNIRKEDNYFFVGKVDSWDAENTNFIPTSPKDSLFEENSTKKSILCAYKIYETDAALGIKREGYEWTSGTVYDEYDDRKELENLKYYTIIEVNSKLRVYKCLNNNNGGQSTVVPQGDGVEEEYKSDGYVWKFLYEIPEHMEKFITNKYIPVPIIEDLFYLDERSLQLDVQINAKPGAIEEINFSFKTSQTSIFNVYDIINPNYNNESCRITEKEIYQDNSIFVTVPVASLTDPIPLNPNNNYYDNNYIMVFITNEGEVVATIKNYTFVNTDQSRAIVELCDVIGGIQNIDVGSMYAILPKIQINGDGENAVAVPVFSDYDLIDIELYTLGTNYTKAEAFFLVESQYELNPIISPIEGHGYSAYNELPASNIIISKILSKHTETTSGSNKYYFGNGNDVHQFGIIHNLKSTDGSPLLVEKQLDNITLIKATAQVILTINDYNNITGNTDIDAGFFANNNILTKGSSFKKDQFRARIDSINIVGNDTVITCTLLNGLYENYINVPLKNETTKLTFPEQTDGIVVSYNNLPDINLFNTADYILGNQTLFTGKIIETISNDSNYVTYKTEGIEKIPIKSYYDGAGDLILGEKVTLFYENTDGEINKIDQANMNVLEVASVNSSIDTCYSYIIKLTLNSNNLESGETVNNPYIQEGDYLDKYIITKDLLNYGRIVHVNYNMPVYDIDEITILGYSSIEVYIKPEKGIFCQFSTDEDREVYIMTTDPYLYRQEDSLIELNAFVSTFGPTYEANSQNLNINSGNVLYLENIRYISLTDDQSIEANIVLEF